MLDKTSKAFLTFLDALPNDTFFYIGDDAEYPDKFGEQDELFALIRHLEAEKYVESVTSSSSGAHLGVRLSHKGIHRKEFARQELMKYLEEKWIDFFSLLVSLSALIISIIALLWRS